MLYLKREKYVEISLMMSEKKNGEELCCKSNPPQAENPEKQDSFLLHAGMTSDEYNSLCYYQCNCEQLYDEREM